MVTQTILFNSPKVNSILRSQFTFGGLNSLIGSQVVRGVDEILASPPNIYELNEVVVDND